MVFKMNNEIVPVSKIKHRNYYFHCINDKNSDFSNFKNLPNCPVFIDEIKQVASCFPIVFLKNEQGSFRMACVFSLLKDLNVFINSENNWLGSYIPAFFRCQPFFLVKATKDNNDVLCFNSKNPAIKSTPVKDFLPFMTDEKEISEALKNILKILFVIEKNREKTHLALESLKTFDLIKEWKIKIKTNDSEKEIQGFFNIDEEKLKSLSASNLHKLNLNGALEIAYAQLISNTKLDTIGSMHLENGNIEKDHKNLRDKTLEKQQKEKKKELDQLVENLFDQD